jgi:hypothetical protein
MAHLKPFIALLLRFQPDDALFLLPLQEDILALSRPIPSFAALRVGIFSLFCRFAGLHSFTGMPAQPGSHCKSLPARLEHRIGLMRK